MHSLWCQCHSSVLLFPAILPCHVLPSIFILPFWVSFLFVTFPLDFTWPAALHTLTHLQLLLCNWPQYISWPATLTPDQIANGTLFSCLFSCQASHCFFLHLALLLVCWSLDFANGVCLVVCPHVICLLVMEKWSYVEVPMLSVYLNQKIVNVLKLHMVKRNYHSNLKLLLGKMEILYMLFYKITHNMLVWLDRAK